MPHYTALTAAATGGGDPKMGYQSPPLLANGVTTTLMEYQPKEMQQMQAGTWLEPIMAL